MSQSQPHTAQRLSPPPSEAPSEPSAHQVIKGSLPRIGMTNTKRRSKGTCTTLPTLKLLRQIQQQLADIDQKLEHLIASCRRIQLSSLSHSIHDEFLG